MKMIPSADPETFDFIKYGGSLIVFEVMKAL